MQSTNWFLTKGLADRKIEELQCPQEESTWIPLPGHIPDLRWNSPGCFQDALSSPFSFLSLSLSLSLSFSCIPSSLSLRAPAAWFRCIYTTQHRYRRIRMYTTCTYNRAKVYALMLLARCSGSGVQEHAAGRRPAEEEEEGAGRE